VRHTEFAALADNTQEACPMRFALARFHNGFAEIIDFHVSTTFLLIRDENVWRARFICPRSRGLTN